MAEVIMPKMGDAMEEGRIIQWLKNVGDTVKVGDPIAEIETDKSNVEIEAEEAGTLQNIAVPAGDVAPVGSTIATIGQGAAAAAPVAPETPKEPAPAAAAPAATATPAPTTPSQNGNGSAPAVPATPAPVAAPVQIVAASQPFRPYDSFVGAMPENLGGSSSVIGEPISVAGGADGGRVRATPVAKAIAQANGISLSALRGSGPDGGIVKKDVEAALAGNASAFATAPAAPATAPTAAPAPAVSAPAAVQVNEGDEVQEYNGMRRTIARRLSESKSTIPHFYVTTEIDMEALIKLREQVNANAGENGVKVSINDCLIKAVAVALAENPKLNSAYAENKRILRKALNVGFGVSVADGLIVPVVKNCENLSLRAIARATKPLIEKARNNKLAPADYTGGTFTISNMGVFPDIEEFQAIVNPGEGAILAVASTRTVPAVVGGEIVPRKRMKVSLSADHRIVDGADGAQFLITLKRVIENPLEMLA